MKYAYLHTIRSSSSSIVKRTKCDINDFSVVSSAKTVSWTSFTLRFYQLCGDFLQVIRWQFSRWLRLKIASGRVERNRGPVFTNRRSFCPRASGWLSPALLWGNFCKLWISCISKFKIFKSSKYTFRSGEGATIVHLLPSGIHCIYIKPRDHKSANHVSCSPELNNKTFYYVDN
jgi:hypothetical protein